MSRSRPCLSRGPPGACSRPRQAEASEVEAGCWATSSATEGGNRGLSRQGKGGGRAGGCEGEGRRAGGSDEAGALPGLPGARQEDIRAVRERRGLTFRSHSANRKDLRAQGAGGRGARRGRGVCVGGGAALEPAACNAQLARRAYSVTSSG